MHVMVRMTRDMRPWQKGADVVLPETIAKKLIADHAAEDLRPFPPPDVAPPEATPRPILHTKRYMTRKRD